MRHNTLKDEYLYRQYVRRENDLIYAPYDPELEFYDAVSSGNVDKVKKLCEVPLHKKEGFGQLSDNELQNMKYHMVVATAMVARRCIEKGMAVPDSFELSDFYIYKTDKCQSVSEIGKLHNTMCIEYTKKMHELGKRRVCSKPVAKTMDYICDHLHEKLTVSQLAKEVGLSSSYLSRIFSKETGMSITEYVMDKKLTTAENMLAHTDYGPADIASMLCFCSQSYFSEQFKKKNHVTPKQYRDRNYRSL